MCLSGVPKFCRAGMHKDINELHVGEHKTPWRGVWLHTQPACTTVGWGPGMAWRQLQFACIAACLMGISTVKGHLIGSKVRVPGVWIVAAPPFPWADTGVAQHQSVSMPHAFLRRFWEPRRAETHLRRRVDSEETRCMCSDLLTWPWASALVASRHLTRVPVTGCSISRAWPAGPFHMWCPCRPNRYCW